ncbi:hypothetical protein BZL30_3071 [Mycobacterium kansasii]|uniref:Uncharacterized protein n=1 Tax=Mycobacterium kansasii TaxID=1768 RepID=A0A1V3XAP4_MYCKA|nr:hypothetical protein BZL30_3071 [Mycobacterium kansasii]
MPQHHGVDVDDAAVGFGECPGEALDKPQRPSALSSIASRIC